MKVVGKLLRPVFAGVAICGALVLTASVAPAAEHAQPRGERIIRITAKNWDFSPGDIVLKKGQTVVFELTSQDRVHGLGIEDFRFHAEIVPGQVTRVRFTPDRTGTFDFECDEPCGMGHDEMIGTVKVVD